MKFYVHKQHDNGCTYYRQTLPLASPCWRPAVPRSPSPAATTSARKYSACFFNRYVGPEYLPALIAMKRQGKTIVWDIDDDLFAIECWPAKVRKVIGSRIQTLLLCLDLADLITVSTEHLARRVGRPDKTMVCPNLIDLKDNPPEPLDRSRLVILFTGSPSHTEDLDLVKGLYHETKRQYPWFFYGLNPPWIDRHGTYIPWSRVREYPRVCRLIRPWVSLCPLQPCSFNESKSPIKVWECATLGGSVLASDTGAYRGHPGAIAGEGEPFTVEDLRVPLGPAQRP